MVEHRLHQRLRGRAVAGRDRGDHLAVLAFQRRQESLVGLRQAGQAIAQRNADEEGEGAVAAMIGDDLVKFAGGGKIMARRRSRSEEHTSELQSLMRSSYAVLCLKKKKKNP